MSKFNFSVNDIINIGKIIKLRDVPKPADGSLSEYEYEIKYNERCDVIKNVLEILELPVELVNLPNAFINDVNIEFELE